MDRNRQKLVKSAKGDQKLWKIVDKWNWPKLSKKLLKNMKNLVKFWCTPIKSTENS